MPTTAMPEIDIVVAQATKDAPRHQAGCILPFDDGRLFLSYSYFYTANAKDDAPAYVAGRWSHDEGDTWGEPFEIQENIGKINCMTPSMLRLPSGRILFEFMRKDGQPGELHPMIKYSDDECQTWSEPTQITQGADYWITCHDRLFRSSTGRVLLPVSNNDGSFCWMSDDNGETWFMGDVLGHPEGAAGYGEQVIEEMADGSLKMWMRNGTGRFHVAVSVDDGQSWTLHSTWGPNVGTSPCFVRRIPDTGDLMILWNNNQIRTPLTCGISSDDGETWRHIRDIEPMREWPKRCIHSYPTVCFLNGNAHITYYESMNHSDPADNVHLGAMLSLKYRRMPLSWFYAD